MNNTSISTRPILFIRPQIAVSINHSRDTPRRAQSRTPNWILEARDKQGHEEGGQRLEVVGVRALGAVEAVFLLGLGRFGGAGVGIGIGHFGRSACAADDGRVPGVEEEG